MHGTYRASSKLRWARATLTVLAALATAATGYRLHQASTLGLVNLLTAVATLLLISAAFITGWMVHVRTIREREMAAAWKAVRARRDESLLDGEEDRALWDSVPAAGSVEDTCVFGTNVVAINQFRHPRAS